MSTLTGHDCENEACMPKYMFPQKVVQSECRETATILKKQKVFITCLGPIIFDNFLNVHDN